jgi:Fe-S cluster assembly iron-binding protein IscA
MSLDSLSQEDHDVMGLVAVDPMSWDLIANSELNYVTGIGRRAFDLIIPSSTANCGCGKSFQILSQH